MLHNINAKRFETLRADLHAAFGHAHSAEAIDAKLDQLIAEHTAKATLEEFIPVFVEREANEYFGEHRIHVRFAAGTNAALANAAVALTKKYAGEALYVDAAASHPENAAIGHMQKVFNERGLAAAPRHTNDVRTVAMPDFIVFLGTDAPRDEAGKEVKVWPVAKAETLEQSRELADDLEARVLYMLNKLGISPVEESVYA
ncbi:three-helix bundle dimerization domain-containing protein [Corynebacterium kozikiae]|uniref:three-helix bundle dimerization domain-containing protein n=1 Tax=Corynebacterium kozikiae TaxID=2968469 RepID=UPI00211B8BCA|nr:protein tyrosine phosphatase [Corynebacterium sp. 76QC2CO]MCQ9343062.1 protein tyrosine phosphatase [Corynebacterium sp. 76QC2CO]